MKPASAKKLHRWKPGESGNPRGRKPGTRNKATALAAALLEGEAEALTRTAIRLALAGDPVALRLALERLIPPARERPVEVGIASPKSPRELPAVVAAIFERVAAGELLPDEGRKLAELLGSWREAVELSDLSERIKALEERTK